MRFIFTLVALGAAIFSPVFGETEQPIAYSHKLHISKGLTCIDCHSTADTQAAATIPSVNKCMLCHAKIATDKPEVQKIAAYAKKGHEIPWVRIYSFEQNALVRFQHAPHVKKGVQCATCHGDMTQASTAQQLVKHTMGTCIHCHRQNQSTLGAKADDCATCHY
jgi:hypothetical protein